MIFEELRKTYHKDLLAQVIRIRNIQNQEIPNFADKDSKNSVRIAQGIMRRLPNEGVYSEGNEVKEQTAGGLFEKITRDFLRESFNYLSHLRPGPWVYEINRGISDFEQYAHLGDIAKAIKDDLLLSSVLGRDYIIAPDIVISRRPVDDSEINKVNQIIDIDSGIARYTPFRANNFEISPPILHASISCKFTIRSDRSQNTRTEALNLIRNRKGNLPHVVAVTAEPYLNRLASIALGTGDLDCVYHFALKELKETIEELENEDMLFMLNTMIEGKRLRDISDLPFDLAV